MENKESSYGDNDQYCNMMKMMINIMWLMINMMWIIINIMRININIMRMMIDGELYLLDKYVGQPGPNEVFSPEMDKQHIFQFPKLWQKY